MKNDYKSVLLQESFGKASAKLRKNIIFHLAVKCKMDTCYRCNEKITNLNDLSIEHKISWQKSDDPIKYFYDMENIAFSHLKCNILAINHKGHVCTRKYTHGVSGYRCGCKCNKCKQEYSIARAERYKRLGK